MSNKLPEDVINYILSYGDPETFMKFSYCHKQLLYNKKEFDALRVMSYNFYYLWMETEFMYFAFNRAYQKKKLNNIIDNTHCQDAYCETGTSNEIDNT